VSQRGGRFATAPLPSELRSRLLSASRGSFRATQSPSLLDIIFGSPASTGSLRRRPAAKKARRCARSVASMFATDAFSSMAAALVDERVD